MDATPDELKTLHRIRDTLRGGDSVIIARGMAGSPPARWPDARTFEPLKTHPHRYVDEVERIPGVTDEQSCAGVKDHRAIRWRWYVGGVGPVSATIEMDNPTTLKFLLMAIRKGSITIPNWKRGDAPWRRVNDDAAVEGPRNPLERPRRKKIEVKTFGDFCSYVSTRPARAEKTSSTIESSPTEHETNEASE